MTNKILNNLSYYKIEQLTSYCHCGLCGNSMEHNIVPKDWAWGICTECIEKEYKKVI